MGHLETPALPEYLYRYRNIRTPITVNGLDLLRLPLELQMITEQKLWCANYKALNDPMEGYYQASERVMAASTYAETASAILHGKRSIGICCFSDTHDNELMWTHYADEYRGICIGYHPSTLLKGIPDTAHLARLGYGLAPPRIGKDDSPYSKRAAIKVLSHKKACWAYEREWRVLAEKNLGDLTIAAAKCIRAVYLGSKLSDEDEELILHSLRGKPVAIKRMKIDNYKYTWKPLQHANGAPIL